jgi:hypothetical protein
VGDGPRDHTPAGPEAGLSRSPLWSGRSVTGLALLPLVVVILGGRVTSTLLNLFLLPPLDARFGRPVGPPEV